MNKIWLSSYPTGVPEEINPEKYASIVAMFEDSVRRHADRPAYINMGKVMTYRRLEAKSREFAAYLQNSLKLKQGDRVAIMMPNLLQYPVVFFGILRAGMVAVNVNPLYTPRELEHQLNDAGAKAIVIVSNFAHTLEKVVRNTQVEHVILSRLGDMFSPAKRTVFNFAIKYIKKLIPKYDLPNAISFRAALSIGKMSEYIRPNISAQDLAMLQYTGGTTGLAKGAMLTHRNLLANIEQIHAAYGPILKGEEEFVVTALPLYHIFALTLNCLLTVELGGTNLLITNPRDIGGMIKEMSRYPFTILTGVNTLFNALLNHEDFKELDFSHLHLTVGGGMSVHRVVAERWHKVTNTYLLEGYGLTECSPIVSANPYTIKTHTASIGIPFPSTEVKLVNEQGAEVTRGEAGELLVKGPQVMKGYWQRPEATKEILKDGWLSTGDIAIMDEHGFMHIVDRKKDMIIVSGFNVYPNEIEDVLAMHPKIAESAVVGMPDEQSGEVVKACIVKKDPSLTRDDVIMHCRKHLTAYKVPKRVAFFDELPKSNIGKILRKELKASAT